MSNPPNAAETSSPEPANSERPTAKPRARRRWWRWPLRLLLGLFILAAALYGYALAAYYLGPANPKVDYLAELNRQLPQVPPDQQAWPIYREVLTRIRETEQDLQLESEDLYARCWVGDEPTWQSLAVVRSHQNELELARRAAALPAFGWQMSYTLSEADRVAVGPLGENYQEPSRICFRQFPVFHEGGYRLGLYLEVDAYAAAHEQRFDQAILSLEAIGRLANQLVAYPLIQARVSAVFLADKVQLRCFELLMRWGEQLTPKQIERISQVANSLDPECFCMPQTGWLANSEDFLQWRFTASDYLRLPESLEQTYVKGPELIWTHPALWPVTAVYFYERRDRTRARLDEVFRAHLHDVSKPPYALKQQLFRACLDEIVYGEQKVGALLSRDLQALAGFLEVYGAPHLSEQRATLIKVAVALQQFKRKHGRWPNDLQEMVPKFLVKVPYCRASGLPLEFRTLKTQPVLSSSGADLKTDSGFPSIEQSDMVYNEPLQAPAYGTGFNGDTIFWPRQPSSSETWFDASEFSTPRERQETSIYEDQTIVWDAAQITIDEKFIFSWSEVERVWCAAEPPRTIYIDTSERRFLIPYHHPMMPKLMHELIRRYPECEYRDWLPPAGFTGTYLLVGELPEGQGGQVAVPEEAVFPAN